ncbi:hypothetical protein ZWY2020_000493 [Hordeum vulgare]|nr:hypothetical protein ZWY2020_000493 [Hordeum vulgare]
MAPQLHSPTEVGDRDNPSSTHEHGSEGGVEGRDDRRTCHAGDNEAPPGWRSSSNEQQATNVRMHDTLEGSLPERRDSGHEPRGGGPLASRMTSMVRGHTLNKGMPPGARAAQPMRAKPGRAEQIERKELAEQNDLDLRMVSNRRQSHAAMGGLGQIRINTEVLQVATLSYVQQVSLGADFSCFSIVGRAGVWA